MPKGRTRVPKQRVATRDAEDARGELLKDVFTTLSDYIIGCAQTVGMLGTTQIGAEGIKPGHLTAAMKVLDFLAAHAGTERDEALEKMLETVANIRKAGNAATKPEGSDRAVNPD